MKKMCIPSFTLISADISENHDRKPYFKIILVLNDRGEQFVQYWLTYFLFWLLGPRNSPLSLN